MILIIGEDGNKLKEAKKKIAKMYNTDEEDIKTIVEISRILVPMSKEKRKYLYDYSKTARELAQEADMVYLYRKELIRLK